MLTINVTWDHIRTGQRREDGASGGKKCAVELAFESAGVDAVVFADCWRPWNLNGREMDLPSQVWPWIEAFDKGEIVEPISFEVEEAPYV